MHKKDKMLFEDLTAFQDKWATGMSGRSVGPKQMTLLDLLNKAQSDQHLNNVSASGPDIYGSQMMVEMLGDMFMQSQKLGDALKITGTSILLKDRPKSQGQLKKMIQKVRMIQKLVESIGHDVGNFVVDKEKSVDKSED